MITNKRIPLKTLTFLLIIVNVILLIPMLKIAEYDVPACDDYGFGIPTHTAYLEHHSFIDVAKKSWERAKIRYYGMQGNFAGIFMFGFTPFIFGEQYYGLTVYIMLIPLLGGLWFFTDAIFSFFTRERRYGLIIFLVLSILCTQFPWNAAQSFYWYNGSVFYTFFFGISLFCFGLLLHALKEEVQWKLFLEIITVSLLCVVIGFSNFITALSSVLILASGFLLLLICRNKAWKRLILPFLCCAIAFYFNVSAPGNSIRQANYVDQQPGAFRAIQMAFEHSWTYIDLWTSLAIFALLVFLVPIFWQLSQKTDFAFPLPGLISLYSYGLLSAMFCPTLYAYNNAGPGRVLNIIYYAYIIMAALNLFYWIGWIRRKNFIRTELFFSEGISVPFTILIVCAFLIGALLTSDVPMTSYSALKSYFSGEAGLYGHVNKQRLAQLKDPEVTEAEIRAFPVHPYLLYIDDITEDPTDWRNGVVARFYGKNSVKLKTGD